jgi:hypothetical protein
MPKKKDIEEKKCLQKRGLESPEPIYVAIVVNFSPKSKFLIHGFKNTCEHIF